MTHALLLAHLIGDYVLQGDRIARWKARSVLGVLAHGAIVTAITLLCLALVIPSRWPFALVIGVAHTAVDLIRARFLRARNPTWELIWYLFDQAAHLSIIGVVAVVLARSDAVAAPRALLWLNYRRWLAYAVGYLLLAQPAWVLLRLMVRGLWGGEAAPRLGEGDKYGPMCERMLIATGVLLGQLYVLPLALLPRRLLPVRVQGNDVGVLMRFTEHWAETLLGVLLATSVGLVLRRV